MGNKKSDEGNDDQTRNNGKELDTLSGYGMRSSNLSLGNLRLYRCTA
jgi:hypothetical protein